MANEKNKLSIDSYEIFLDLRDQGFKDIIGGYLFEEDNGDISFSFFHSILDDAVLDDQVGTHMYFVRSKDGGKTWEKPEPMNLPRVKDKKKETCFFGPLIRTKAGSVLYAGRHQTLDNTESIHHKDMQLRDYMGLFARREKGETRVDIQEWPSGTFLGEQFVEGALQLPSGRILMTIWGVKNRGENSRCGVLLSDDDGESWSFKQVGYEPDLSIRKSPTMPSGFNEQTLFYTHSGKVVSIIRAGGKMGVGVPGGGELDTWFFRSESVDDGETWSKPELTNLPGTGAALGQAITLPDSSLFTAVRIPYSREYYDLPEKELFGVNFARSFDEGHTWEPEFLIQRDPEGNPYTYYYNSLNGVFRQTGENLYSYYFGFVGYTYEPKLQRMLKITFRVD